MKTSLCLSRFCRFTTSRGKRFRCFLALACLGAAVTAVRAQSPGALDPTFPAQTDGTVRAIAVQGDGKILLGGDFSVVNGTPRQNLARLNADGLLDDGFDPGADGPVYALAIQPADGLIVVGGSFGTVAGSSAGGNIGRLYPDGTADMAFVAGGAYTDGPVYALAVLRDGKIALGGDFFILNGQGHPNVGYLHGDGSIAADVLPPDPNGPVYALTLNTLGDGVVFGGAFTYLEETPTLIYNRIAALDKDGALDTTFNPGKGANDTVYTLLGADGTYLAGGLFTSYDGTMNGGLALISNDGGAEDSLNLPATNGIVYTTALQSALGGGVAIGGTFTNFIGGSSLGATYNHVAQLVLDGPVIIPDFDPGTGTDGPVYSVAYQADGLLLVGGAFTTFNGTPQGGIARVYTAPAVNVSVNQPTVSRAAGGRAKVTFTLGKALTGNSGVFVNYKVKGPLVNGTDYKELDGSAYIAPGDTKAVVKVKPIAGGANGAIKIIVLPNPGNYSVGSTSKVKIKITD